MTVPLILASASEIRAQLLGQAEIPYEVAPMRLDEEAIIAALTAEQISPDQIADALANAKAEKAAGKFPDRWCLGCDQVLAFDGQIFQKPKSPDEALQHLKTLRGQTHHLYSAAVLFEEGKPIWRFTGHVRLAMRAASDEYLQDYVSRNWPSIQHAVGCYKLEEEGVRLFSRITGDYFHILGLPLLELSGYLTDRGMLRG